MSKRLMVLTAVIALIKVAAPDAEVLGLDDDAGAIRRVGPEGQVIIRSGDPGNPEIDLSPLAYNYDHVIPLEIVADTEAAIDAIMVAIGSAVEADRFLGGLCMWLDAIAPDTEDVTAGAAAPQRGATLAIIASYTTTSPLT